MPISLRKIAKDLAGDDQDIRILALTTVVQLSPGSLEDPSELGMLRERLVEAVAKDDPETVFLARKGLNHVEALMTRVDSGEGGQPGPTSAAAGPAAGPTPAAGPAQPQTPAPVAPPPALDRSQIHEILAHAGDDPVELARALAAYTRVNPGTEDIPRIVPFLSHVDPRVRANAVDVLDEVADPAPLLQHLAPMLEDQNNRVRANVTRVLGKLGFPRVVQTLRQMSTSGNLANRESAVYAMGFLKGKEILDLLTAALRDPYEGVRLRAVRSLGRLKDPRSLPALKAARNDVDIDVCEEADKVIRFITMESPQPTREGFGESGDGPAGAGVPPAADPPAAGVDPEAERLGLLAESGRRVFELCRLGQLPSGELNRAFYDALKFTEFLRKHQERVERGALDVGAEEARRRLEEKIEVSFQVLGRAALELARKGKLRFDGSQGLLERLSALGPEPGNPG